MEQKNRIRNIALDMGGVVIDYDSMLVIRHFVRDEAMAEKINTALFCSYEWCLLDMGVIPEEDAFREMAARYFTTKEEERLAKLCFDNWHLYNMFPKPGMAELISELKQKGCRIYLFSNASIRMCSCYKDALPEWRDFDGILYSAETGYIKPQKEFYEAGFRRFGIDPAESFFVDDMQRNVDGAAALGMKGYCFSDGDVEKLRKKLLEIIR